MGPCGEFEKGGAILNPAPAPANGGVYLDIPVLTGGRKVIPALVRHSRQYLRAENGHPSRIHGPVSLPEGPGALPCLVRSPLGVLVPLSLVDGLRVVEHPLGHGPHGLAGAPHRLEAEEGVVGDEDGHGPFGHDLDRRFRGSGGQVELTLARGR